MVFIILCKVCIPSSPINQIDLPLNLPIVSGLILIASEMEIADRKDAKRDSVNDYVPKSSNSSRLSDRRHGRLIRRRSYL